jgi:hypothetical protein
MRKVIVRFLRDLSEMIVVGEAALLPIRCSVFGFLGDDVYVNRGRLAQEAVHC